MSDEVMTEKELEAVEKIAEVIAKAVAKEREENIELVEAGKCRDTSRCEHMTCSVQEIIAAAIRARGGK